MKKLKALLNNEKGNVLVIFAFAITALIGATALVVDIGFAYHEKSTLQNAVDAAALGGAQGLITSETQAASIAKEIGTKNSISLDDSDITFTSDSIRVTKEITVPMFFAKALGNNTATISATAKAKISLLKSAKGVTPIAVEKDSIPTGTQLKCSNTGTNHGNCGYLDISGNGADGLVNGILNGSDIQEGTQYAETEPGQKWGPVKDAFETLITNDAGKDQCDRPDTADNSCDRVIYVVVIDTWDDVEGKESVTVEGLAAYWISHIDSNKEIVGQFLEMVTFGEIGGSGEGNLYGVALVE